MNTGNQYRKMDMLRILPPGWRWFRLDEIVDSYCGAWGQEVSFKDSIGVRVIGTSQISNEGGLNFSNAPFRFLSEREKSAICYLDDLMVVKSSGSASNIRSGKTAICSDTLSGKVACGNFLMRLVPKRDFAVPFLIWKYLNSYYAKVFVRQIAGSSTYPNIKWENFRHLPIPLPPLAEQQRIATILNEQLAAVDKARAAAEAQLEAAKALPAAYLREVFPRPGQELPAGWKWVKLGEICEFLDSKRIPVNEDERRQRILGKPLSSLYPYYGANGQVGWIDDYIFDEPLILLAEDGGLFGSLTKSIAYKIVGKSWVNNHAHVLRPKDGIDTDFCLLTLSIRPDIGPMVTGNTRPKLNQEIAAQIQIPLPPLSEQKRIAAILNKQLAVVDIARTTAEAQLCEISTLPSAILRKAFNGEL